MSHLRLLGHSLWMTVAVSLLALAIAFTGTRVLLSFVSDYRADVEQRLSAQLGVPVKIGGLRGTLRGFQPELRLMDVRVVKEAGGEQPLQMREIRLGIDLFRLLGQGEFWPDYVSLVGTSILIERHVDGHISVAGVRTPDPQANQAASPESLAWLLSEGTFEVIDSDIMWWDHARDRQPISLSNTYVLIENGYLDHRVAVQAELPAAMGQAFELRLHLQGDLMAGQGWEGRAWFKGQGVNLAAVADRLPTGNWQVGQGVASVQLWSSWAQSQLTRIGGRVVLEQPRVRHTEREHQVTLDDLSAAFLWQHAEQGWRLHVSDLAFSSAETNQSDARFSLEVRKEDATVPEWVLVSDDWALDALAVLALQSGLLSADQQMRLQQLQPSGTLGELRLFWQQPEPLPQWSVCAELAAVNVSASQSWPGGKQLSGQFCADAESGWLSLDSQQAEISLPKLFRKPLPVNRLYGDLQWSRHAGHWQVSSNPLYFDSPDVQTVSRLTLNFPHAGGKPWMDIQTDFKDADATQVPRYLPAGIMGPKTMAWLDRAFQAGTVPEGSFIYRGEASGFPFRDHAGVFQVLFNAQGVTLDVDENWPRLTGVDGVVEFKNQGLTIMGSRGQISGNRIKSALVNIPDLQHSKRLLVQGEVEDDVAGLYQFFRESPLSKVVGGLLSASEIKGPGQVWLDLGIPLRSGVEPRIKAAASVQNGTMRFLDWGMTLSKISGDLRFDQQGLQAKSLNALWLGRAVQADIRSDAKQTEVTAKGRWPVNTLADAYPSLAWGQLKGSTRATLKVQVPKSVLEGEGQVGFELTSDLKGLSVNLPQPLAKAQSVAVPFKIQLSLGDPKILPIRWSYGKRLQGLLEFKSKAKSSAYIPDRADIHFGSTQATRPPRSGIRLSGQIDVVDVEQWQRLQSTYSGKSGQADLTINQVDLTVKSLNWSQRTFPNVAFKGVREGKHWLGQVAGPLVEGQVRLPEQASNQHPLVLKLKHLHWPKDESATDVQADEEPKAKALVLDPKIIPPIQLTSEQFNFAGAQLGRLVLTTHRRDDGLAIQKLDIKSVRDHLQANGSWTLKQQQAQTQINGTLKSEAMGALLDDLGFTSQLRQTNADIQYQLSWTAAPYAYENALLSGNIKLRTGKGRLLDLEPGVGRVFGLLSLGTIQRRLQLDFSDLLQKGMSFDRIKADYQIRDGQATTDNFSLEGPAAQLDISGRIGLGERDYDQLVTVTPKTTASLPVAGAIAGGPVVGAAVFLAQKLVGKSVDQISRYQYQVTGSWDDPQIQQIRAPTKSLMDRIFDQSPPEEPKYQP